MGTAAILQRDGITLAFGMEWFPVLGQQPQSQAVSLARRRRAAHCVLAAGAAASAGLLRERPAGIRRGQRLCSAAAVFARLHPAGTVAAIMSFPGNRQWLIGVHEGAVMTRTDQLHDDTSGVQETIRALREAHPGLVVHEEDGASSRLLDVLFQAAQQQGQLQRVRARPGLPLLGSAVLLSAGLWWLSGHSLLASPGARDEPPVVDPDQAWRKALAAAAQSHHVHGVAGLHAVVNTLHTVPVYLSGWLLKQVECRPRGARWQCQASFRRDEAGDNQSLIDAARPDWRLTFDPMEGAMAAWSVAMPALPLSEVSLRTPRQNEVRLVSALQSILPAFQELRLESAQPLPVRVPLDAQQRPIARPPGLVGYQRRAIHLQAPLRSLSLLLPDTLHMSWERVVLQFATLDQPTLRSSSLRVSLSGVLYETDDTTSVDLSSADGALVGGRHTGVH